MSLMVNMYKLLKRIALSDMENFSGIGIVVYGDGFSEANHCPQYSILDDEAFQYLINISDYHHALHDGFHMVNEQGILTHVAQYFVPPVVKDLQPNQEHGVRLYSSMCGSTLAGVSFICMISSDKSIYFFRNGEYVNLSELEKENVYAS